MNESGSALIADDVAGEAAPLVAIRSLSKYYTRGEQIIPVLIGIDLDVYAGDFVALRRTHEKEVDHRTGFERTRPRLLGERVRATLLP